MRFRLGIWTDPAKEKASTLFFSEKEKSPLVKEGSLMDNQ